VGVSQPSGGEGGGDGDPVSVLSEGDASPKCPGWGIEGVCWLELKREPLTASGQPADEDVVSRLFECLRVAPSDVEAVLQHAASVSRVSAESLAASAGDQVKASVVLGRCAEETSARMSEHGGDLARVAAAMRSSLGLKDIRCLEGQERITVTDAYVELIDEFATRGVTLPCADTFIPTCESRVYPTLRSLTGRVYPAILTLLANLAEKGQAVVLPREEARSLPGSNSLPIHWVPKPGNPLGRLIADASGGLFPPNGSDDAVKLLAKSIFGPIELPREVEVAEFLLREAPQLTRPSLSVDDVAGAFSRLWLTHKSAVQAMLEVTLADGSDVNVILTSMYFGGTSCPYAWNPVSCGLSQLLSAKGLPNKVYVDDILRVGEAANSQIDGISTRDVLCSVLTPGTTDAWAKHKADWGRTSLDFIGWSWDVESLTVSLTKRTVVRFMCRLVAVLNGNNATVSQLQGIASLGSRVSTVLCALRPLAFVIYSAFAGTDWRRTDVRIALSPLLKVTLAWWLHILARAWNEGHGWSTPLYRLVGRPNTLSLQFDGSTSGIGGVSPAIHPLAEASPPSSVRAFAYRVVFAETWSSGEQNTSELIAVLFGVACFARLGLSGVSVGLVGDSQVALTWAARGIRSLRAVRTYLLLQTIVLRGGYTFGAVTQIPSKANVIPDKLSRDVKIRDLPELAQHKADVLPSAWIRDALAFVNPLKPFGVEYVDMLSEYEAVDTLTSRLFDLS